MPRSSFSPSLSFPYIKRMWQAWQPLLWGVNSKQPLAGRREMSIQRWCGEWKHPRSCQNTLSDSYNINRQAVNKMLCWMPLRMVLIPGWDVTCDKIVHEGIMHKQHGMFTALMLLVLLHLSSSLLEEMGLLNSNLKHVHCA